MKVVVNTQAISPMVLASLAGNLVSVDEETAIACLGEAITGVGVEPALKVFLPDINDEADETNTQAVIVKAITSVIGTIKDNATNHESVGEDVD